MHFAFVTPSQSVDQITGFRQFDESFDQTFSKVCEVKKRGKSLRELRDWINPISQPLARSAEREIFPKTALFFLPSCNCLQLRLSLRSLFSFAPS